MRGTFPSTSAIANTPVLPLADVTGACISTLTAPPLTRARESASRPDVPDLFTVPSWVSSFTDKIIPQAATRLYVSDGILDARGQVGTSVDSIFPNYQVKIYQLRDSGQLVLVAVSNELEINPTNRFPRSLPFFIYIHPSPQDTVLKHRALFPQLYAHVADADIPLFYKDLTGFPFTWDFLFFQFLKNLAEVGLPAQLKKADKPFVLVIPMIKSFQEGLGVLGSAASLERCLLGIEREVFADRVSVQDGVLPEVEWVSFAAFSIGNEILNRFVQANANNSFARSKIREYILFDPPPNNPSNRSTIVQSVMPLVTTLRRAIRLYGEDPWYFEPLLKLIAQKRLTFTLNDKVFSDPAALPEVFLAFLRSSDMTVARAVISDDPHVIFPVLFTKDAAKRTQLPFVAIGSQKFPDYPKV